MAMISPAASTMVFMGRLQSNAPVSAAAMVRDLSNPVPGPAFQPTNITASVFDLRHRAPPLCTNRHKIKPGMRNCKYPQRARSRGPRTLRPRSQYLRPDFRGNAILRRSR
jgi:hypothetical protein